MADEDLQTELIRFGQTAVGAQAMGKHHQKISELRDRFAMAALTGIVSKNGFANYEHQAITYAGASYKMADAMLAARQKERE